MPREPEIQLGHGMSAMWLRHAGHDRAGIELIEANCTGRNCQDRGRPGQCSGSVLFNLPGMRERFPNRTLWTVVDLDQLTLFGPIACGHWYCPTAGEITKGLWVPV